MPCAGVARDALPPFKGGSLRELLQVTYGDLDIDARSWEVRRGGVAIDLTRTEFEILALLASRPREVVTDEELTREIWGEGWFGDDNNLAVHVSKLRHKLGESGSQPHFIRTVRSVGYRFEPGCDGGLWRHATQHACEPVRRDSAAVEMRIDAELRVASISPRDARVLGFEAHELLGQYFALSTDGPWRDRQSALRGVGIILSCGVREWTARHVLRRADGCLVQAEFATCLLVDSEGCFEGVRLVVTEHGRSALGLGGSGGGGIASDRTPCRHALSVSAWLGSAPPSSPRPAADDGPAPRLLERCADLAMAQRYLARRRGSARL